MSRRVVITGLGPITAFGVGINPLWEAMCEGRSAIGPVRAFDPGGFSCRLAAELPDDAFSVKTVVPKSYRKATKVMCRDIELAIGAAHAAVVDAGLVTKGIDGETEPTIPPGRFGCHIGAGLIAADVDELAAALMTSRGGDGQFDLNHWGAQGMQNLTPLWLLKYLPNMLACHVTIVHDCRGPSNTITCCEASSALSLGESMRVIERGSAEACLSGGAEYKLNPMAYLRQHFAGRLAKTNGEADATVARPFDPAATGTVLGEGGGILVLEAAESAEQRGAMPYAEVEAFAATQSHCPDTAGLDLPADGESIADAMRLALDQAKLTAADIDAIVPFGSSIPSVDAAEAAAIRAVFGERASAVPIITTVPNAGNCAAGNGAVGACIAARCLREQKLPARLNTTGADGLEANACPSRETALERILIVTTSQGGQNAAIVLKRA
ncbi:MAG: beta-ketoacyl synthase N-terminal-like domain-containing protein [Planctomycetota bacterium]|nr:beta-ketoacyl synthase N-terminal-like domain-containing protein [Planctomycetota bacterium]